jgi:hypothetical protein
MFDLNGWNFPDRNGARTPQTKNSPDRSRSGAKVVNSRLCSLADTSQVARCLTSRWAYRATIEAEYRRRITFMISQRFWCPISGKDQKNQE